MQGFQRSAAREVGAVDTALLRRARAEALRRAKPSRVHELIVADDLVIVEETVVADDLVIVERTVVADDTSAVEERDSVPTEPNARPRSEWLIRAGVASLFIVNAIIAVVKPEEFVSILESNVIAKQFAGWLHLVMVRGAAVADLSIAALLLSRRNDRLTFWLMAVWMGTVAVTKAMNLFF